MVSAFNVLINPRAFKINKAINGTIYVEKKTIEINKYSLLLEIGSGLILKKSSTPIVGMTIGCNNTDMSLWNFN